MKKINKKNRIILLSICILLGIISYAIHFYNSSTYEEFENTENVKELIPYEEEIQNSDKSEKIDNSNEEVIIVHITGAVKNWGIIELPTNSRIADAIEKAGGLTEEADISSVNLAYPLEDGMKIKIPSINETIDNKAIDNIEDYISMESGENVTSSNKNNTTNKVNIVNINTATQTELETLPGIGTSTALKIINYRNENGKFNSIEDIKNVSGIGESKFEVIKELICI